MQIAVIEVCVWRLKLTTMQIVRALMIKLRKNLALKESMAGREGVLAIHAAFIAQKKNSTRLLNACMIPAKIRITKRLLVDLTLHVFVLLAMLGCTVKPYNLSSLNSATLDGIFFYSLRNGVLCGESIRLTEKERIIWDKISKTIHEKSLTNRHLEDCGPSLPGLLYILANEKNGNEEEFIRVGYDGNLLYPYYADSSSEELVLDFFRQLISRLNLKENE